jgi:Domain of unknown function (DUF4136)
MKWIAFVLLTATACGAALQQQPNGMASSFAAPRAEFGSYETFSFGLADPPKSGYDVTPRSLEVMRRLQPLVLEALRARGYKDDATKVDFVVKLAAGTGVASAPPTSGANAFGDSAETQSTGIDAAEGYIGINIYDAATGSQVWQGTAFAEIDPEKIDDALLKRGVAHMLASVPLRKPLLVGTR